MNIEKLVELLHVMENDPVVVKCDYLTDGDPDEYPESLTAVIDHLEEMMFDRKDAAKLEKLGYSVIYGECLCIDTLKGVVNTGSDNM